MASSTIDREDGWLIALIAVALAACGGGQKPSCKVPDTLVVELETSDRVNTDVGGASLATVIRIYQLTDVSAFEMASFEDIWQNPEQALGPTLTGNVETTMYPGQRTVQRITRNPQAFFVAAVAVFRRPAGTAWRTIQPLPPAGDPCAEMGKANAGPRLKALRMRIYLEDYRIESVANFSARPRGSCDPQDPDCIEGVSDSVPDELGPARPGRGLRPFAGEPDSAEEDDAFVAPSTGRRRRRSGRSEPRPSGGAQPPSVPQAPQAPQAPQMGIE